MIKIAHNGSKYYGQQPDTIEDLINVLANHPLNREFEQYGNFVSVITESDVTDPKVLCMTKRPPHYELVGLTHIHGNFFDVSHAFGIFTDETDIINKLTRAIRENQEREDYTNQDDPISA